ncbi:chemotaxis protein CheA [Giesbergeria anulus]|uniref:Chemotaxis protein CheA n=1 Tax=Giesbergeria anulus TaxID=180197 RepID=A0A1H9P1C0_9BURK|nr:chemotaxis protein CheA [Giesbergeria anulus]SER41921.1 two-component system, chemotaxis family, sensor kinase CheA [Giesbergeria anulus]
MNLDEALQIFLLESRELLEEMETCLLSLEEAEEKTELVNAIFRAAHTIKGSSGLFGLDGVVAFTHITESVLDRVRDGRITISDRLIALLLSCRDHIGTLIDAVAAGQDTTDPVLTTQGMPLLEQLRSYLGPPASPLPTSSLTSSTTVEQTAQPLPLEVHAADHWHISVRFDPNVLRNGMDPLSFLRFLQTIGKIVEVVVLHDKLPNPASMDPESCYLGYELVFESNASKTAIENAFEFVRDDCQLRILPPHSRTTDYIRILEEESYESSARIGEMMVHCGALTQQELDAALHTQTIAAPPYPLLGKVLVQQQAVTPEVVEAAVKKQAQLKELHTQESRSIRIDADKLDQLINLVGELIIVGAGVNLVAQRANITELQEHTSKLSSLVEEVRDSALQLRMVKIGATFSRFQRVVHDVSRELGKDISLLINGEETELDKTVVEKIGDPLMHLVRNSMDHGIESAEVRLERGKPAQGTLRLNAFHDSGSIVITVEDDGGGLKRDKILSKAIERGLLDSGHHLTDSEVYALIFEPGFSTADKVSNLSGRGVGLDVVKRNIAALRGSVNIQSVEGEGTTVTIRLPLTLAIIDGFLVEVDSSVFAIPLDMIEECVAFSSEPGHNYTNLRNEILPFIRLRELFDIKNPPKRRENIVVLKHGGQKAGLVVDTLLGEFQTVIKPLGKIFNQAKCISGSTILGSGEVALILDVPVLIQQASHSQIEHKKIESLVLT